MTAREKFQIGDRVRVAKPVGGKGKLTGTVVEPWPSNRMQVRVLRDGCKHSYNDGIHYWKVDRPAPLDPQAIAAADAYRALKRAASSYANAIDMGDAIGAEVTGELLRDAALAFARSLSKADRERLGR